MKDEGPYGRGKLIDYLCRKLYFEFTGKDILRKELENLFKLVT